MTNALELEKISHAATQVDLPKVKSSQVILAKLISDRKDNKAGLGYTHEPMPEYITNTLPDNFNPNDHSPENEQKFKEHQRKHSESGSSVESKVASVENEIKEERETFVEMEVAKVDDGYPAMIKSHVPASEPMKMTLQQGPHVIEEVIEVEDKVSTTPDQEETEHEYLGFSDPEFLKWHKEQQELAAAAAEQLKSNCKALIPENLTVDYTQHKTFHKDI